MATQVTLNSGSVDSAGSLALKTNGTTTAVTIDTSQNVGVGNASPSAKLHVSGNAIISTTDNTNAALRITQLGTGNALLVEDSTNPDSTPFVIDASGRVISGHTSSLAIGSDTPNIQTNAGSSTNNGYGTTNWTGSTGSSNFNFAKSRSTTIGAPSIVLSGDSLGKTKFYGDDGVGFIEAARIEAAVDATPGTNDMPGRLVFSTTADGASTPTERMRIDSSGNVGIGTTPSAWGSTVKAVQLPYGCAIFNIGAGDVAVTQNAYFDNPNFKYASTTGVGSSAYRQIDGTHRWLYAASGTAGNNITFTEAMRIDSSGNLLVGTTTSLNGNTSYSFQNNSSTLNTMWIQNANTSDGTAKLVITSARAANAAYSFIDCGANWPTSFSRQFQVSGNGVIYAQNTTVQSLSDIRTKENIRNSEDGLDVITALRPVRFDFKEGFGNNRKNQLGFIAQEIEPVFSDAVSEWEQGGEAYKSVGPGALIPVLVKAIQEQQAIIQTLTDRITALEQA